MHNDINDAIVIRLTGPLNTLREILFYYIEWPPASPDLSPIETVWDDMKDYIQEHYPQVYSSYKRLREAVQEAWESVTHERIRELIHDSERGMKARCQAVIDAQGWHTKF